MTLTKQAKGALVEQANAMVADTRYDIQPAARSMMRELAAALASASLPVEQGWRDISSAPKDGTDVLLFYPLEGLDHRHHPQTIIGFWRQNKTYPKQSGWVFQGRALRAYSNCFQPTHWLPLPTPPVVIGGA